MERECKLLIKNNMFSIKEALVEDNFCPWMTVDFKTFYTNTVEVSSNTGYRPGMR
jgi:hypothetical protein